MTVGCWSEECIWNKGGWCQRGMITIDELKECEAFEDYQDTYTDSYWVACEKDGEKYRKLVEKGKRIEYEGYVFYTNEKITDYETYYLTEERTGMLVGEFGRLKEQERWNWFVEKVGTYPDVLTLPVKDEKGGEG